jgi:hypothetical protein
MDILGKEGKIEINGNLFLESPTPLSAIDTSKLRLFEIKDTSTLDPKEQKIEKSFRLEKDLLYFKFKRPIANEFKMMPLNFKSENWYTSTSSDSNRVYTCRITDNAIALMDTLKFRVLYDNHFFLEQTEHLIDTFAMPMSVQKILSRKRIDPTRIELVLNKPQNSNIEIIPEDFFAKGSFYQIQKNATNDSIIILLTDPKIIDKDTLTFSMRCFDYIGLKNDSVYFNEAMRLIYKERQQYIVSIGRPKSDEIKIVYNKPLGENPQLEPLSFTINTNWFTANRNPQNDTIEYKITDPFVSGMDSLKFLVKYQDINRKGITKNFSDTLIFVTKSKKDIKPRTETEKIIKKSDQKKVVHIYLPVPYKLQRDTINIRRIIISSKWKSDTKYRLKSDSLAFVDFFGKYNNESKFEFATREMAYYAKLTFSLKNIGIDAGAEADSANRSEIKTTHISKEEKNKYFGGGNLIFQLLNEKGLKLKEYFVSKDTDILIEYLHPGKYRFKIIFDKNGNGKWDTGNYFKKMQPERVIMSQNLFEVKSKFENVIEWNVGDYFTRSFTAQPQNKK